MANLFNRNEKNKKDSSLWETLGGIALGAVYIAAAVGSAQNEYNDAVRVMETLVPKYEGFRNHTIPTSDWEKLEHAEKVFAQHARTMDNAADNRVSSEEIRTSSREQLLLTKMKRNVCSMPQ